VSSERQVGTWNLKCQASCALDSLLLPNNVLYNHLPCIGLILMGPNRSPKSVYPFYLVIPESHG
jgi:hypothetical protein